jgi:hypothetical protein
MTIRNRELSQFGSFIFIDDNTQNISLTNGAEPYVGIGTTNPQEKLQVAGNVKIDGNLIVDGNFDFDFDNFSLQGDANINITGIVTAKQFVNEEGILAITDRWDRNGNDIHKLIGNVGIGSSIPQQKLDVIGNTKSNQFISTITTAPPFLISNTNTTTNLVQNLNADYLRGGRPGFNNPGDIVTVDGTQTLTNKSITNPLFGSVGIRFSGTTSGTTTLRAGATATGSLILPTTNGTLVSTGDTGVVTSNMIADLNIANVDIATNAAISYSKLNLTSSIVNTDIVNNTIANVKLTNSTISGVSLGGNLFTLTRGTYLTGSNYNGSFATTWAVDATSSNTADKVVARDGSGNFSANTITLANNLTASNGTVTSNTSSIGNGGLTVTGTSSLSNTTISGITSVTNTQNATSTTTGALRVSGGVGVANDMHIGGSLRLYSSIRDVNNNVGTAGSVLSSTGSSVQWISAFPTGGIILWSGSIASIPSGWALCNGSNGTPDLTDRFVIGAGGSFNPNTSGTRGGYTGGTDALYYALAYIMKL